MLTLQEMTQDLYTFTSPPVPADCAAKYSGSDAWMCVWPSYRLPFVATDYFMTAAQFDVRCVAHAPRRSLTRPTPPAHSSGVPDHV